MGMDAGIINSFVHMIIEPLKGSGANLLGFAKSVLMIMLTIDFIVVSLSNLEHPDRIKLLVQQILKIGCWIWVVNNAFAWADVIRDSLGIAGTAMSGFGAPDVFKNPGDILTLGMSKISPIFDSMLTLDASGPLDFIGKFMGMSGDKGIIENVKTAAGNLVSPGAMVGKYLIGIILYLIFFMIISLALIILTCQVITAIIEFQLIACTAVILIPFGSFKWLSFVGEKAVGAVWSSGIKLMVMQILTGFIMNSLGRWPDVKAGTDVTSGLISGMVYMCAMAFIYVALAKEVPSLVSGLLSGSPNLSAGDLNQGAGAVGSATSAATTVATKGANLGYKLLK